MEVIGALDGIGIYATCLHFFDSIRHRVFPCDLCLELGDRYGGGIVLIVESGTAILIGHLTAYHARGRDIRIGEQARCFPVTHVQHIGAIGEVRPGETAYIDHCRLAVIGIDDPFIGIRLGIGGRE